MKRMGVFESSICHYCGGVATTEDHIVPRALLPRPMSRVPYWFRSNNVVPACKPCNGEKSMLRSDCSCPTCTWAWNVGRAVFIPLVRPEFCFDRWPVAQVVRSPG